MKRTYVPEPFETDTAVAVPAGCRIVNAVALVDGAGVALPEVFVDGEPVPRTAWPTTRLRPGQVLGLAAFSFVLNATDDEGGGAP